LVPWSRSWRRLGSQRIPWPKSRRRTKGALNSCIVSYHLAQVNIARMKASPGALEMAGLVARIVEMNQLAEGSKGFVWRLHGPEASPAALRVFENSFVPFEPGRLFYNLSVWETIEDLSTFAFRTAHAEMLRDKARWMDQFDRAHLALWWIPV